MASQTTIGRTDRRRTGASSSRSRRASRPAPRPSRSTSASRRRTASRSRGIARRSSRPAVGSDHVQVQRLLDRFCDAFTQGDGRAAAQCFAYPNLMVMGNGTQLLEDEDTVASFFDAAPAQYQSKGIYDTRADIHKIDHLNDRLLLVHAHWPYIDAEGQEMDDGESSIYLVRREPRGKAVIAVAVPLGTDSERGIDRLAAGRRRRSPRASTGTRRSRRSGAPRQPSGRQVRSTGASRTRRRRTGPRQDARRNGRGLARRTLRRV